MVTFETQVKPSTEQTGIESSIASGRLRAKCAPTEKGW